MDIKEYQLINNEYKITYTNGNIIFMPKKVFENTDEYLIMRFNKAKTELLNSILETYLGKLFLKILDKLELFVNKNL